MLLGLLREGGGFVPTVLHRSHVTHDLVRKEVEGRRVPGEPESTSVDMPLSSEAKRALQCATEEADRARSEQIDSPHLLLGLLREPKSLAAIILNAKGVRLDEVREEVRLQAPPTGAPERPAQAFHKLVTFLRRIEDSKAAYHVCPFHEDAVRVDLALPDERWVATFFADGRVAAELFSPTGSVQDEAALTKLLERLESKGDDG